MAEFPYVKIWVGDLLRDTMDLNAEEFGCYLLMMFSAWSSPECRLIDDDRFLARICRLDIRVWRRRSTVLRRFWTQTVVGGTTYIHQKRLLEEWTSAANLSSKNASNARAKYSPKPLENNKTTRAVALRTVVPNGSDHSHSQSHSKKESNGAREESRFDRDLQPSVIPIAARAKGDSLPVDRAHDVAKELGKVKAKKRISDL